MGDDPLIEQQFGAYLIKSKLGEGGMAQVYKAYHARLRREVAIKVILPQIADQAGFLNRFEREAQLVASLEHRNIVAVYDFGEVGNRAYLVMQYVGGGTLRDLLDSQGRIEPHKAIQYAIQMAGALHHAHQRGIVHRDVKPQNMLISSSDPNELLLSDFGIAKLLSNSSSQEESLANDARTMPSDLSLANDQLVGTAQYMAPEQINGQPVDARTDVYALGIVLFQMLSGQVPFSSTTIQGLLFQHIYTPPPSVREINPSISPMLEQIIMKALAKAPEHRYQSAEAMAQALMDALASGQNSRDGMASTRTGSSSTPGATPNLSTELFPSSVLSHPPNDIFISYNEADRNWAEWIAWQLEEERYSVVLPAWDFRPGSNFTAEMQKAAAKAECIIIVLSSNYLDSGKNQHVWTAIVQQVAIHWPGKLLPMRVCECEPEQGSSLETTVYVDLVGLEASIARQKLLSAIRQERAKPIKPPLFPGEKGALKELLGNSPSWNNSSGALTQQIISLVETAFRQRDWYDVIRKTNLLIKQAPDTLSAHIYHRRGQAFIELEQTQLACEALEQALALTSKHDKRLALLYDYTRVLASLGEWERVHLHIKEALYLKPNDPTWLRFQQDVDAGLYMTSITQHTSLAFSQEIKVFISYPRDAQRDGIAEQDMRETG